MRNTWQYDVTQAFLLDIKVIGNLHLHLRELFYLQVIYAEFFSAQMLVLMQTSAAVLFLSLLVFFLFKVAPPFFTTPH